MFFWGAIMKKNTVKGLADMRIHADFVGGNITVERIEGNHVHVKNQLRNTGDDWFYWAFCVEGAAGQELAFHFERFRLGKFGPAVSHDFENWAKLLLSVNRRNYHCKQIQLRNGKRQGL